jgi:hypothetical protein
MHRIIFIDLEQEYPDMVVASLEEKEEIL